MSKVRLLSLVFLSILVIGCDDGYPYSAKNVPSKIQVTVERQILGFFNTEVAILAQELDKNSTGDRDEIIFQCPCFISGGQSRGDTTIFLKIEGDSFKISLLPGAIYNVSIKRWDLKN